ncbi:MAG: arginine--tRNA ligase [Promethearchaeia archaeon]|nr:MAG: arginine--tRNA ligase [Candidatus Lokiarchaeia archaeon]
MKYAEKLAEILAKIIDHPELTASKLNRFIESAKKSVDADFTIICFKLQKILGEKGPVIAETVAKKFTPEILSQFPLITRVEAEGAYLNFTINKSIMAQDVIRLVNEDVHQYSISQRDPNFQPQKIVIEYPSPNTNKPLHFGHVRNMLLGQSLAKLNRKMGHKVFETNLLNDRGIHICKSMWAYQRFGKGKTPESENQKPDHFVGDYYVKFNQEEARRRKEVENLIKELETEKKKDAPEQNSLKITQLEEEIDKSPYGQMQNELKQMLIDWENNVTEVRAIWKKMNYWAEKGFKETFLNFKISHDKTYYESQIYDKGKSLVLKGLENGIFEKFPDGAVIVRFSKKGLPKQKVLLRSDGTSLYITQDLYLAYQKYQDFAYNESIYVVGNEQNMQMKILFELLSQLGLPTNNVHYSYGMIYLNSGKMKSREGKVVDADNVISDLTKLAEKEILKRDQNIDEVELKNRAKKIAMAALRFFILKYEYSRDFLFDPEQSISFDGETGPYILYAYARICSIYRKVKAKGMDIPFDPNRDMVNNEFKIEKVDFGLLQDQEETALIYLLHQYPQKMSYSCSTLRPHELMRYVLEVAQQFTRFYHACPVLSEETKLKNARLALCETTRLVIKDILNLFEIQELIEM